METRHVIEFRDVTFAYNGRLALENVSLSVHEREFASVVGPNGGGKTTLLKLILGILRPQKGEVVVFDQAPQRVRTRIGYTPQHSIYDPQFPVTVMEVVLMGRLGNHGGWRYSKKDKQATRNALEEMALSDLTNRPFNALSGGQRQRALVARALVSAPDLLLLDEPTANMDAAAGDKLLGVLSELNKRMTILMVSHDLGFVSTIVDSVLCVNRTAAIHPTSQVTGDLIREMYGEEYRFIRHDHRCAEEGHKHD